MKTLKNVQLPTTEDYYRFQEFVNKNKNLWVNLIERLYDEFEYEKDDAKKLLINKFSELGKTTCKISGRVFTINVELTPKKIGEFKLKKCSYSYCVHVKLNKQEAEQLLNK